MSKALASHWRAAQRISGADWPHTLSNWLLDSGSLTQQLIRACDHSFRVSVVHQGRAIPKRDEARALNLPLGQQVQVREVQLLCGEAVWVVARTVIPLLDLRGPARQLTRLGTKPLGAALFATPGMRREKLQIAKIPARSLPKLLPQDGTQLWGRRSLFRLGQCRVLVHEVFCPAIGPSRHQAKKSAKL